MHCSVQNGDFNQKKNKKRRHLKMISSFSILLLIMGILMLLSWILHWAGVQTEVNNNIAFNDWKNNDILRPIYEQWTKEHNGVIPSSTQTWFDFLEKTLRNQGWTKENNGWFKAINGDSKYLIGFNGAATFIGKALISPIGIADWFYAPIKGFIDKTNVIIFVLCIGAFIFILVQTKALEGFSQAIVARLKGKEVWAIVPLMTFFSIFGSVEGMAEESLGFYMICIPLMLMAGFDVFTGVLIIMIGAGVGVLASTVNPFLVPVVIDAINSQLPENAEKMTVGNGLVWRILCWFIFTSFVIIFTMMYAIRVKKTPSRSVTFSTLHGDKEFFLGSTVETIKLDWRKKTSLILFAITFIIMIVYLIGWDKIFNTTAMEDQANWLRKDLPYLAARIPGWGNANDLSVAAMIFLLASIVLGFVNWMGETKFIDTWFRGACDILSVSLIIGTAAGIGVILSETNLQSLFVSGISSSIGGIENSILKSLVLFIIFIPLSFLIPSTTGFATAIFPLLTKSLLNKQGVQLDPHASVGAITAFQFASGLVNLITPTSGVVMGAVAISRMSYTRYLKGIMSIIGCLFVMSIILICVGGVMPFAV
ncbi:YfcC family protein [Mycoplasma sp. HU2014]|uniref:YfcC family protein n=1 Tax=Mycoplasma sp. HU2014 TaxID=1664275 RepID=UPI00067C53A2|nr:YfcC family protein [Mycoplasma sp. HU2014]